MNNNSINIIRNLFLLLIMIFLVGGCSNDEKFEINAKGFSGWQYTGRDKIWRKAYMPESIQSTLKRDTLLKNMFFRNQFLKNYWTDTVAWIYKASINVDRDYAESHFDLKISGLVGIADVFFNDTLVFNCNNMFIDYSKDVSHIVRKGDNKLLIKFLSYDEAKKRALKRSKFNLPFNGQEMLRLSYFYFDTISGIRYLPTGLIKNATLIRWNKAIIRSTKFETLDIEKNANIRATYIIDAIKNENIDLEIKEKNKVYFKENINLTKGTNKIVCEFQIKNPKLWWTHDLGEPYLYNLKTRILKDNEEIQKINNKIGIRKIDIDITDKNFNLKLNGVPVVLKIMNYVSPEIFYENIDKAKYEKYVNDFVFANINMVHVSENGRYEDNAFYNECDRQGVLVWQDFMLPYKIYSPSKEFLDLIEIEATQNIKKLRNHPSIAFWSGQNSFDKYWYKNAKNLKKDSVLIKEFNNEIFGKLLPKLLRINDSGRYYFEKMNFLSIVNIVDKSPEYPHITTIRKFTNPKDRRPGRQILILHQKPYNSDSIIKSNLDNFYGQTPEDITAYSYLNYLYTKNYIEQKILKQRFNSNFNGFIVGNYRDYSPVISTSAVDYNGFWKGKMFGIKAAFEPILFNITEKKGWIYIEINSDLNKNIQADFYFKLSNYDGKVSWRRNYLSSIISKNSNKRYFSFNLSRELSVIGKTNAVFKIEVFHNQDLYAEKYFLFVPQKSQFLKSPKINQKFYKVEDGYVIEFSTNYFANGIYVFTDREGILSNNFFCLAPGETKKISFITLKNIYSIEGAFLTIDFSKRNQNNLFSFKKAKK